MCKCENELMIQTLNIELINLITLNVTLSDSRNENRIEGENHQISKSTHNQITK